MNSRGLRRVAVASLLTLFPGLVGCVTVVGGATSQSFALPPAPPAAVPIPVRTQLSTLRAQPCTNTFVEHSLPYTTTAGTVKMFESNGSGLAINDLDGDGDLDLVFANLKGANAVLWNDGALRFRKEEFRHGDSRAVNVVDVDGDGRQDIVFTRRLMGPSYWRNTGHGRGLDAFEEQMLREVDQKVYALTWGDIDGDGDLDAAGGSYDAALEKDLGYQFMRYRSGGGVYLFENRDDAFQAHQLAQESQALAVALADLNQDGKPDILIGNDFGMLDQAWQQTNAGWQEARPFARMTHSTMSFDWGDIDNDGQAELFATDMKPYNQDVRTLAEWRPMMSKMPNDTFPGDPQIMENVLQVRDASGAFQNEAYTRAIDATGWSWSGKFGDLDNDGWLDLYVVNGMIAADLFHYLPRYELVEENRAFRNDGAGTFALAPEWSLGSKRSGRGMSMADLDGDGDLDIVVNNLESPAQIFENRLCGGSSVQVDLFWPLSKNTRAIGAQLVLRTSAGNLYRDVRAASGYLSGDPARVHFGLPPNAQLQELEIRWPDGQVSTVTEVQLNSVVGITR